METNLGSTSENDIIRYWRRLSLVPGGATLFSWLLGWFVPYSGSIRARVKRLEPGLAQVVLNDRRGVRNHLQSIHAIALMNLGEMTSGLAVLTSIPKNMRGIVLELRAEYLKKARGRLYSMTSFELPASISEEAHCEASAEIKDETGELVAIIYATWLIGFKQQND